MRSNWTADEFQSLHYFSFTNEASWVILQLGEWIGVCYALIVWLDWWVHSKQHKHCCQVVTKPPPVHGTIQKGENNEMKFVSFQWYAISTSWKTVQPWADVFCCWWAFENCNFVYFFKTYYYLLLNITWLTPRSCIQQLLRATSWIPRARQFWCHD